MDYAYTLQGWIKGVNSNTLQTHRDMGVDGDTLLPNPNKNFAKDGFGYTLNYYTGDYKAIDYLKWNSATDRFEASTFGSDLIASRYNLFDGNISSMVTTIVKPTITPGDTVQFVPLPQGTAYKYDQLNRLVEMTAWQNLNAGTNTWDSGLAYAGMYNNKFTYDANGGLLTALAKNQTGTIIDKQIYQHQTLAGERINNRIYAINDSAVVTSGNDLLDQITFDNTALTINSANNYSYTEMGELKSNKQDSIDLITWTLYGKLKSVTRSAGCSKRNVIFDYDAGSNRVAKHIYTSSNEWISSEYYIRNASGEIMSTYKNEVVDSSMSFAQIEKHIYGSNLVGIDKTETEMISALPAPNPFPHTLGNKYYTGNNHLGNVLITFTDRKIPVDLNNDSIIDEYWPDVISSNDYAPFGGALTERTFNKNTFPNSFNGKRDDKELNMQDYGMRPYMQDARFVPTMDPLTKKYPELSPYQFASNNPIWNIDLDGLEGTPYSNLGQSDPNKRAGTYNTDWGFATASSAGQADNQGGRITGTKYYNYSLPWTTLYLWQKPVPRVVTTTNVDPNIPPGNPVNQPPVNVVRNINFNPMSPVLTASGTNQINQIAAMAAPTQVVQNNGAAMPQPPVTTMGVNSEGLPMTTTTQQTIQPVQQITTTSTITVNLSTALAQDANSTALLTARFNAISAQLQAQGIAPGNIIQGTQNFGVAGLQNGNQTNFQINTTTTTANGSQSTTTTTVTDSTYEKN
ncbi:MAG: hypothetical protein JNL24_00590 [Bacteroidia bacterium]|nr:hypothetical protein [Bacteroidia bacterium]